MKTIKISIIALFAISFLMQPLYAQLLPPDSPKSVGWEQNIGDTIPKGLTFTDASGQEVRLDQIIDKPTAFNFVFFSCPGMCDPLLEDVSRVIEKSKLSLGEDYNMVTLSFDTGDKPEAALRKKENYVQGMSEQARKHWYFLTGDSANIQQLTGTVGFKFKRQGAEFSHPLGLAVVSTQGKITRYLFGTNYLPFDLKMAIAEAQQGKERPVANKVLQLCYNYNPNTKSYSVNVTTVMGSFILFLLIVFVIIFLVRRNRKSVKTSET
mgnify:CR=1 FL=1